MITGGHTPRNFEHTEKAYCLLLYYVCLFLSPDPNKESEGEKKVVSVTGAAAPQQDITGIYDVLNVSFVPPCGSSLWQLGKAAACNELIIHPVSLPLFIGYNCYAGLLD